VHTVEETGLAQVGFSDGYGGGAAAEPVATFVSVLRHAKPLRMIEERPMLDVTGITVDHNRVALSVRGADAVLIGTWNPRAEILDMRSVEVGAGLSGVAFESDTSVIALAAFDRKLVRTGVRREYPEAERARALIRRADPKQKATLFGILGSGFGGFDMGRGGEGFFESRMLPGPALSESLTLVVAQKTALPAGRYDAELALGRRLFHSTTNGQISSNSLGCVSCHPDGREDGLVWRLQGTRRQTPLLAGRLQETAPYNWKGTGKTLEQNVGHTTERLGGTGLSPASRKALARYLVEGLRPVAAPRVEEAARVARGGEVFHDPSVGCATCHPSDDGFTDGAMHDVASVGVKETAEMREAGTFGKDARQFDSPDLRKLAITAPYFHDGSRPTLEALLEENHDQMGHTSGLTAEDRAALVAYLRSL
jgi:cytochrome c peroxidase